MHTDFLENFWPKFWRNVRIFFILSMKSTFYSYANGVCPNFLKKCAFQIFTHDLSQETHQGATLTLVLLSWTSRTSIQTSKICQLLVWWTSFSGLYAMLQYNIPFFVTDKWLSNPNKYKFGATCLCEKWKNFGEKTLKHDNILMLENHVWWMDR